VSKPAVPPRLKRLVKAARKAGWTYDLTAAQHPRLTPPRGLRWVLDDNGSPVLGQVTFEGKGPLVPPCTFSATPSDVAGDRNSRAALRRAGVAL
jgi:hypothetical protein